MLSVHNGIKLKFNKGKIAENLQYLIINNRLVNNTEVIEEISRQIEKYFVLN